MAWYDDCGWDTASGQPTEQAYLGNGILGWRLSANALDKHGRCFVTGFADKDTRSGETRLAEIPNPLHVMVDFGRDQCEVTPQSQRLDFKQACLCSEMVVQNSQGRSLTVAARNVAYRSVPSLLGVKTTVTPTQSGPVRMAVFPQDVSGICRMRNAEAMVPSRIHSPIDLTVEWETTASQVRAAAYIMPILGDDTPAPTYSTASSGLERGADTIILYWENVPAGKPIVVDWLAAIVSDTYHPKPLQQAGRMIQWGAALGVEKLFARHCALWAEIWRTRPLIEGDADTQRAVDGSMFYLHSSVHRGSRQSMAPFGLSSSNYNSHVFWDCETWTFPPILLQNPEAARSILTFRLDGLTQARKTASLFGYDGAMFPWEAIIGGAEDTPMRADSGFMEHHITPDIAFACWQYQCAHGDEDFLQHGTWPILRDVARWIVSRVEKTARGYEIHNLVPADEFCVNINNSAHMNLACAAALRFAITCAGMVGVTPPSSWARIAEGMYVPRGPDGMILQQDGWTPAHISKQADTTLAIYPMNLIDDPAEIAKIIEGHVKIDPQASCTVAMGDQINAVVCARAGKTELARMVWDRGWKPFWIEEWGMYAETVRRAPGCFITGCGGLMQAVLMGFPGLQLEREGYAYHPVSLPKGWDAIRCECVYLGGKAHRMTAEAGMQKAKLEVIDASFL